VYCSMYVLRNLKHEASCAALAVVYADVKGREKFIFSHSTIEDDASATEI